MNLSLSNGMTQQMNPGQSGFPMAGGPQRTPNQIQQQSENDKERVLQMARQMIMSVTPEQRAKIIEQNMPLQVVQQLQAAGKDPLFVYFTQQAFRRVQQSKQSQAQQRQPPGMPPNFQGMPMQPGQQRPMNPGMMNNMAQAGGQMPFGSNMESIINEQKQGMMAERQGQLVVPASSGPGHNPNSQPPFGAGLQPQNMFPQGPGQTPRPQMPNGLGLQQQQQALMKQQLAQSQAQAQARQQAAANLQGQPGGLSGPMPVSQTPAMTTLNAAVGQPPVAMGHIPGAQAGPGNPALGAGMNARFGQPGPQGPATMSINDPQVKAMMASLDPESQEKLRKVSPDQLSQMFQRWKQQHHQQMAGRHGQLQPGMPMNPTGQGSPMGMPPQQMAGGAMNPQMQALLRQRQMAQLNSPQVQAVMDTMDLPQQVFAALHNIPPDVKKWGQFRAWLQSTPSIPDQAKLKLKNLQTQQFLQLQARGLIPNRGQPAGPQQLAGGRPNMPANVQQIEVTPQELLSFRNHNEKSRELPDEQLRRILQKMKYDKMMQAAGRMPGMQQPQPPPPPPGQPIATPIAQPGVPQGSVGMPQGLPQGQPNRAPVSMPEPNQNAAAAASGNKANRQPQQTRPAPPNPSPATAAKNLKRPGADDLESSEPAQRPSSQAGPMAMDGGAPNTPASLTEAQIASLTPEQRQLLERKRHVQKQMQEASVRYKEIFHEEARAFDASKVKTQEIAPAMLEHYKVQLQQIAQGFVKTSNPGFIVKWFAMTNDENRLRMFLKMVSCVGQPAVSDNILLTWWTQRMRIATNFADGEKMQGLKDQFTLSAQELMSCGNFLGVMLKELKQPGKVAEQQQQTQQAQMATKTASVPQPSEAHPFKQAQHSSNKLPQRPNSRGIQPPAAPTSTQPPFQIGAASPDGKPQWVAPSQVTQDSLQMPRKRVKTGLQTSSPASTSQTASPQTKTRSPELRKQEPKAAPKPTFPCTFIDCEMGAPIFASEALRKKHHEEFHVVPFQDPDKFLVDSCMELLEHAKQAKPDSATPMSRDPSMKAQGSTSGGSAAQDSKPADSTGAVTSKLSGNIATVSAAVESQQAQADDFLGMSNGTIDPQSLFNPAMSFDPLAGGVIRNSILYRSTTPIEDTPESSKDSGASEPNSDIPEAGSLDIEMNFLPYDEMSMLLDPNYDYGSGMDLSMETITDDMLVDASGNNKSFEALDMSLFSLNAS